MQTSIDQECNKIEQELQLVDQRLLFLRSARREKASQIRALQDKRLGFLVELGQATRPNLRSNLQRRITNNDREIQSVETDLMRLDQQIEILTNEQQSIRQQFVSTGCVNARTA